MHNLLFFRQITIVTDLLRHFFKSWVFYPSWITQTFLKGFWETTLCRLSLSNILGQLNLVRKGAEVFFDARCHFYDLHSYTNSSSKFSSAAQTHKRRLPTPNAVTSWVWWWWGAAPEFLEVRDVAAEESRVQKRDSHLVYSLSGKQIWPAIDVWQFTEGLKN